MPAPTPEERDEVLGLVRWIYERSGAKSWSELARRAEILPSSVSDWNRGKHAPSAYNLVRLMRAAGIIGSEAGPGEEVPDFRASSVENRLESLEAQVEEQGDQMTRALGFLARDLRKLERRLGAEGRPASAAGRKR